MLICCQRRCAQICTQPKRKVLGLTPDPDHTTGAERSGPGMMLGGVLRAALRLELESALRVHGAEAEPWM